MKTVFFTEEQLHDPDAIGRLLFSDEQDPRSTAYVRVLQRPTIRWGKVIACVFSMFAIPAAIGLLLRWIGLSSPWRSLIPAFIFVIGAALLSKRAVICAVRIYQHFAPDSLRNKCRFEPSCSEYMILSIEKNGLCKGLLKGIRRLKRCNVSDGGFDFP